MIDQGKHNVLGVLVDAIDEEGATSRILAAARDRRPLSVSNLAVHGVMTGVDDRSHRYRINSLDLVVPDGQPVRWALNALHRTHLASNVRGADLMRAVCREAEVEGISIYLYGGTEASLARLRAALAEQYPTLVIAGSEPSLFRQATPDERRATRARIRASGAAIVFVGLGCPRQEVWVYEETQALGRPVLALGAAFDFESGLRREAPRVFQRLGLEWLYRLLHEPRRLWRRYLVLNPRYAFLVLRQAIGLGKFDPADVDAAPPELRVG